MHLFVPKIKIESEYDLKELCDDLDCKTLFTDDANINGISDQKGLKLSSAIHHTVFELNENGIQTQPLSANTPQITATDPEYQELRVDHPFSFFTFTSDGTIVFVGQVRAIQSDILPPGFI